MADDSVLDDALDDFRSAAPVAPEPADVHDSAPVEDAASVSKRPEEGPANSSAPSRLAAFDPLGTKPGSASKPAAFDPLKKGVKQPTYAKAAHSRAPSQATSHYTSAGAPPQPPTPASQPAAAGANDTDGATNEDLARGVAQLMAELAMAESQGGTGGEERQKATPHEREIASTLAALAAAAPTGAAPAGTAAGGASSAPGASHLHKLAEQLASGGVPGAGADAASDESFASLADTIMQQLLSKDVLYQPMRDIGSKYPAWLAARRESLPADELQRYEAQYKYIRQICALYEQDPGNFGKLFSLIQEMQACGQPPAEIVQDLAPGLTCGEDGLPQLPTAGDNCVIA